MKLTVAGEKKEFEEGLTVQKFIELENVETPEIANLKAIGLQIDNQYNEEGVV